MAQQNIDFGTFPDDPDADAIRTAFSKVQNNFTELFATTTAGSVVSVNGGAGISVNTPTGNVIVTANLAQVVVSTSSLRIGQNSNGGTTAVINSSIQTLVIDINPANVFSGNFSGVSGALANLNGTLTSNSNSQPNITSVGTLTSLSVTGNISSGNANLGNVVIANYFTGTLTTAAQPNITSVGNLSSLNVTGNIRSSSYIGGNIATTGANAIFIGDGYLLSNLTITAGSSIVNGNSNVVIQANGNVTTSVAGNNDILTITGTGANISGTANVTGNISGGNANLGNAVTANYFIGNLYGNANTAGTVTTAAQPNITSVGTLTNLDVSGNVISGNVYANSGLIKAQYLSGDGSNLTNLSAGITLVNGNSNVSIPTSNGNINMSAVGNANVVVVTGTGVNVSGTINATGTITGNFSGNVITASQGNITSLGNLTSLTVNGIANLGAVGNVKITGGSSNGYLFTDGAGNLTFGSIVNTPPGGANNDVQFKDGGTYQGSSNFTFNPTSNLVSITGNLSVTGNANVGNLGATNIVGKLSTASQNNITEVGTLDYLIINTTGSLGMGSGNITAGNISLIAAGSANLGNSATANYFIGNFYGTANTATSATNASALLQNTSTATTVYPTFTTSSANGNSSAVFNSSISANLSNASITATTFVGALSGAATSATTAGTVTTAAQGNITSVGTLTSMTSSGNVQGANLIATSYHIRSVNAAVSAAGTVQGNATALTTEFNRVSTVVSGAGVVLPTAVAGMAISIVNSSANSLLVYPATGAAINSLATNAGYSHVTLATLQYIAISSTQWYTVGASYA